MTQSHSIATTEQHSSQIHNNFGRLLFSCLLLLCIALYGQASQAASISSKVDRNNIQLSDTLRLTISIDEQVIRYSPELDELKTNFEVLRQNRSNRFQSMNGRVSSITEWELTLSPLREGELIIPSFEYDGNFSDAIAITVKKASQSNLRQQEIFLESEVDKKEAYVQEQLIFTERLYSRVNLQSYDPESLKLDDARIELLSEHDYQTRINNVPHVVLERRYAIFPQKSGTLSIPALRWQVSSSSGRRNVFDPFNNSGRLHRLSGEAHSITIKPRVAGNSDWLPAQNLQLKEHWSSDPEQMTVGEPITRSIEIVANGLTAAQLPDIKLDPKGGLSSVLSIYPEPAKSENKTVNNGIKGSKMLSSALVAKQAGQFELPEISLRWWNTQSQSWQTSRLPARQINIQAAAGAPQSSGQVPAITPQSIDNDAIDAQSDEHNSENPSNDSEGSPAALSTLNTFWFVYSILATLSCLVLAFLFWRQRQMLQNLASQTAPVTSAPIPKPVSAKEALLNAVSTGQAQEAYEQLQKYLQTLKKQHTNFSERYPDSQIAALCAHWERHLFAANTGEEAPRFDADRANELSRKLDELEAMLQGSATQASAIPPLYPNV